MITAIESMPTGDLANLVATLTEERDAANQTISDVDDALIAAGIVAHGALASRVRALSAKRDQAIVDREIAYNDSVHVASERDKARADHARAAEDLASARQTIDAAEEALRFAGIVAPGTLTDRIRALASFHRAAEEANNDKSDRLEAADRDIASLTGQLSDLRGERQEDRAEIAALRSNIAHLARVILDLSGAR